MKDSAQIVAQLGWTPSTNMSKLYVLGIKMLTTYTLHNAISILLLPFLS